MGNVTNYKLTLLMIQKTDPNVDNLIDTIIKRAFPPVSIILFHAVVWLCSCVFFTSGLAYCDFLP